MDLIITVTGVVLNYIVSIISWAQSKFRYIEYTILLADNDNASGKFVLESLRGHSKQGDIIFYLNIKCLLQLKMIFCSFLILKSDLNCEVTLNI